MTTPRKEPFLHKQISIRWKKLEAEVDEELAPLILALWERNIVTTNSCQENLPGIAWIEFLTAYDASQFLNLVAVYPPKEDQHMVAGCLWVGEMPIWETMYARIMEGDGKERNWKYNTLPHDLSVKETIKDGKLIRKCTGPADIIFLVSIRLPRDDLPAILELVTNRRQRKKPSRA